jgi:hypothetical protein
MDADIEQSVSEVLRSLDDSAVELRELLEIQQRQIETINQIGVLSTQLGASIAGSQAALMEATQQMQETQMSFNLQYLQLQSQVHEDNRQFTAVSNIMKTKHDTAKNSISNIH